MPKSAVYSHDNDILFTRAIYQERFAFCDTEDGQPTRNIKTTTTNLYQQIKISFPATIFTRVIHHTNFIIRSHNPLTKNHQKYTKNIEIGDNEDTYTTQTC